MATIPGYYTRKEAADRLGISPQRASIIAKRDNWLCYRVGRSTLYLLKDVEGTVLKMDAQKAWAILGIPQRLWGSWWLANMRRVESLVCPNCGATAYSPAGNEKWSSQAACPFCAWQSPK